MGLFDRLEPETEATGNLFEGLAPDFSGLEPEAPAPQFPSILNSAPSIMDATTIPVPTTISAPASSTTALPQKRMKPMAIEAQVAEPEFRAEIREPRPGIAEQARRDVIRNLKGLQQLGVAGTALGLDVLERGAAKVGVSEDVIGPIVAPAAAPSVGKEASDDVLDEYMKMLEQSKAYAPVIGSVENINNIGDAGRYAIEAIANIGVMMVPSLITGGVGAAIARKGAESVVSDLIAKTMIEKAVSKEVAEKMVAEQVAKTITRKIALGAAAGAAPTSYGIEAASIYGDTYESTGKKAPFTAMAYAAPAAALDVIPSVVAINRVFGKEVKDKVVEGIVKRYGKAVAEQAFVEAPTEALQTLIEEAGRAQTSGEKVFTRDTAAKMLDAFLQALIGGSAVGVATQAASDILNPPKIAPGLFKGLEPEAEIAPVPQLEEAKKPEPAKPKQLPTEKTIMQAEEIPPAMIAEAQKPAPKPELPAPATKEEVAVTEPKATVSPEQAPPSETPPAEKKGPTEPVAQTVKEETPVKEPEKPMVRIVEWPVGTKAEAESPMTVEEAKAVASKAEKVLSDKGTTPEAIAAIKEGTLHGVPGADIKHQAFRLAEQAGTVIDPKADARATGLKFINDELQANAESKLKPWAMPFKEFKKVEAQYVQAPMMFAPFGTDTRGKELAAAWANDYAEISPKYSAEEARAARLKYGDRFTHRAIIEAAIKQGKDVPESVLKEYKDIYEEHPIGKQRAREAATKVFSGVPVEVRLSPGDPRLVQRVSGKPAEAKAAAYFGDIPGTEDASGNPLQAWANPKPVKNPSVIVINQRNTGTGGQVFESPIVMVGWDSPQAALKAFQFSQPRALRVEMGKPYVFKDKALFDAWAKSGRRDYPLTDNGYNPAKSLTEVPEAAKSHWITSQQLRDAGYPITMEPKYIKIRGAQVQEFAEKKKKLSGWATKSVDELSKLLSGANQILKHIDDDEVRIIKRQIENNDAITYLAMSKKFGEKIDPQAYELAKNEYQQDLDEFSLNDSIIDMMRKMAPNTLGAYVDFDAYTPQKGRELFYRQFFRMHRDEVLEGDKIFDKSIGEYRKLGPDTEMPSLLQEIQYGSSTVEGTGEMPDIYDHQVQGDIISNAFNKYKAGELKRKPYFPDYLTKAIAKNKALIEAQDAEMAAQESAAMKESDIKDFGQDVVRGKNETLETPDEISNQNPEQAADAQAIEGIDDFKDKHDIPNPLDEPDPSPDGEADEPLPFSIAKRVAPEQRLLTQPQVIQVINAKIFPKFKLYKLGNRIKVIVSPDLPAALSGAPSNAEAVLIPVPPGNAVLWINANMTAERLEYVLVHEILSHMGIDTILDVNPEIRAKITKAFVSEWKWVKANSDRIIAELYRKHADKYESTPEFKELEKRANVFWNYSEAYRARLAYQGESAAFRFLQSEWIAGQTERVYKEKINVGLAKQISDYVKALIRQLLAKVRKLVGVNGKELNREEFINETILDAVKVIKKTKGGFDTVAKEAPADQGRVVVSRNQYSLGKSAAAEQLDMFGAAAEPVKVAGQIGTPGQIGTTIDTKPPADRAKYISSRDYFNAMSEQYQGGAISSRTTPSTVKVPEVGTWRVDDLNGVYGHNVEQLREIPLSELKPRELNEKGQLDPVKRGDDEKYAQWIKEGKQYPPIDVVEMEDGSLGIVDGHRRYLAAKLSGLNTIKAWVSDARPAPSGAKDAVSGKPHMVGLTYEMATGQPWKQGDTMPEGFPKASKTPGPISEAAKADDIRTEEAIQRGIRQFKESQKPQLDLFGQPVNETRQAIEKYKREKAEKEAMATTPEVMDLPLFNKNEAARAADAQQSLFSLPGTGGRSVPSFPIKRPEARGGWTKEKIIRRLKEMKTSAGPIATVRTIAEFDTPEEFADHLYYHGTGGYVDGGLKPSIIRSEREAERMGGGGYGQRYWSVSVTKSKRVATNFSGQAPSVSVYPVILKKDAKVISRPDIQDSAEIEDMIEQLWSEGVDAVKIGDWTSEFSEQELAVINPSAIVTVPKSEVFRVFNMTKPEPLTPSEIEKTFNDAKAKVPEIPGIRTLPKEQRAEAARGLIKDMRFSLSPKEGYVDRNGDKFEKPPSEWNISSFEIKEAMERFYAANRDQWDSRDEYYNRDNDILAMELESDSDMYFRYFRKMPEDVRVVDALDAYKNGLLPATVERQKIGKDIPLSEIPYVNKGRLGEPGKIQLATTDQIKELYSAANQRITKTNAAAVNRARRLLFWQDTLSDISTSVGEKRADVNKKMKAWGLVPASGMRVSEMLNHGVPEVSKWNGILNSSYLASASVSPEEIASQVKKIDAPAKTGYFTPSGENLRNYIARALLGLDTRIDFKDLSFEVSTTLKPLGQYFATDKKITIRDNNPHTVAHEIGHHLDYKWGSELLGYQTNTPATELHDSLNREMFKDKPDLLNWTSRFHDFVMTISDKSGIDSAYYQRKTEVFARFFSKFIDWVNVQAGKRTWGMNSHYQGDKFTESDYRAFVKLLQEKAFVDAKAETTVKKKDIRMSLPATAQRQVPEPMEAPKPGPVFYSALEKAITAAPAKVDNMPAVQWQQWLASNGPKAGVKADEIEWSGIEDFLNLKGKAKVSKAEIVDFLKQNGVKIKDVLKVGNKSGPMKWVETTNADNKKTWVSGPFKIEDVKRLPVFNNQQISKKLLMEYIDGDSQIMNKDGSLKPSLEIVQDPNGGWNLYQVSKYAYRLSGPHGLLVMGDRRDQLMDRATEEMLRTDNPAKYHNYQLPGGENYKELLLTLPAKRYWLDGSPVTAEDLATETGREAADRVASYGNAVFDSSHFEEPNILAHTRMNDRTDANGNKVLFVEEIQSDWAQKGRKEGFYKPLSSDGVSKLKDELLKLQNDAIYLTGPERESNLAYQDDIMRELSGSQKELTSTPAAPFVSDTKSWVALALKRIIRYAAENGYDKVAWTTGEQQAERYDLSKQIESIEYFPQTETLVAHDLNGRRVINESGIDPSKVEDYIGKEAARKLLDQPASSGGWVAEKKYGGFVVRKPDGSYHSPGGRVWIGNTSKQAEAIISRLGDLEVKKLSGIDLKVGGEGMTAFYDRIVPQIANEILKKVGGGKVSSVGLQISKGNDVIKDIDPAYMAAAKNLKDSGIPKSDSLPALISAYKDAAVSDLIAARDAVYNESEQPSFDITPAMRQKVVAEGLPLFSLAKPTETMPLTSKPAESLPWTGKLPPHQDYEKVVSVGGKFNDAVLVNVKDIQPTESDQDRIKIEAIKDAIRKGTDMPPVIVERDGFYIPPPDYPRTSNGLYIVDGHHRYYAAKEMGYEFIPVREYVPKDGWDLGLLSPSEATAIEEANKANIRYSIPANRPRFNVPDLPPTAEMEEVRKRYQGTPDWTKAPNGEKSNLSERQWLQVRTPSFKKWFGDWEAAAKLPAGVWSEGAPPVSKVIDVNGEPLVVYHGTRTGGFAIFDAAAGDQQSEAPQDATFFSDNYMVSATYSGTTAPAPLEGEAEQGLIAAFLNIRNPNEEYFGGANWDGVAFGRFSLYDATEGIEVQDKIGNRTFDTEAEAEARAKELGLTDYDITEDPFLGFTTNSVAKEGAMYGMDGAIMHDVIDTGSKLHYEAPSNVYVTLKPEQIKSAVENTGEFNPKNKDIRYSLSESEARKMASAPITAPDNEAPAVVEDMFKENLALQSKKKPSPEKVRSEKTKAEEGSIFEKTLKPISDQLFEISPELRVRVRRFVRDKLKFRGEMRKAVLPFLRKKAAMTEYDKSAYDLSEKNAWQSEIDKLNLKYDMVSEYNMKRVALDRIGKEAIRTGFDMGWQDIYAPRSPSDLKGFMKYLYGEENPALKEAMQNKEKEIHERAEARMKEIEAMYENRIKEVTDKFSAEVANLKAQLMTQLQEKPGPQQSVKGMDLGEAEKKAEQEKAIQDKIKKVQQAGYAKINELKAKMKEEMQAQASKQRPLTDEEKWKIANTLLKGYRTSGLRIPKPGYTEARAIEFIDPKMNVFYNSSDASLLMYIDSMTEAIELRKFFGQYAVMKDEQLDVPQSIGEVVTGLVEKGDMGRDNEAKAKYLMTSYFNPKPIGRWASLYRTIEYLETLGHPHSAVTQLQDQAFAVGFAGPWNWLQAVAKKNKIDVLNDFYLENVVADFIDTNKSTKALEVALRVVGLSRLDRLAKDILVNGAWYKYQSMSKGSTETRNVLFKELQDYVGKDAALDTMRDIEKGELTDNVMLALFNTIMDFHPIDALELPPAYSTSGSLRVTYMLKTYTIKQLNVYRKLAYKAMKDPDPKVRKRAFLQLAAFIGGTVALGMTADVIKDFMSGRPIRISDLVIDNLLKVLGLSKYQIYQFKPRGNRFEMYASMARVIAPPFRLAESVVTDFARGVGAVRSGSEYKIKDMDVWQSVPILGKVYYWNFGGGVEKTEKSAVYLDLPKIKKDVEAENYNASQKLIWDLYMDKDIGIITNLKAAKAEIMAEIKENPELKKEFRRSIDNIDHQIRHNQVDMIKKWKGATKRWDVIQTR
jgi:hypothetical protein